MQVSMSVRRLVFSTERRDHRQCWPTDRAKRCDLILEG
jgi:hypothetical protein